MILGTNFGIAIGAISVSLPYYRVDSDMKLNNIKNSMKLYLKI